MTDCKMKKRVLEQAKKMDPANPMLVIQHTAMVMIGFMSPLTKPDGTTKESGPALQKAPRDGSTPWQVKCTELAYILYLLEYDDPNITDQQALDNYCGNFDACYIA